MKLVQILSKSKSALLFIVLMLFITIFQGATAVKAESMDELSMPLSTFETFTKDIADNEAHYYKIEIEKNGKLRFQMRGVNGYIDFFGSDGSDVLSRETYGSRQFDLKEDLSAGIYYIRLRTGDRDKGTYTITTSFTPDKKTTTEIVMNLKPGKGIQLSSAISPKETTVWKTSKSDVATVSSSGYVKAKKAGSCYIYATAKDSGATDKMKIVVK